MKQKALFVALCVLAVVGVASSFSVREEGKLSDIALENIEALADEEAVKIPCEYKKKSTCTFDIITPSGEAGTATAGDAVKVGG